MTGYSSAKRWRWTVLLLVLAASMAGAGLTANAQGTSGIKPGWSKSVVHTPGGGELPLFKSWKAWPQEKLIDGQLIRISAYKIDVMDVRLGESVAQAECDQEQALKILTVWNGIVFFSVEADDSEKDSANNQGLMIRRLRLADSKWLSDIRIPFSPPKGKDLKLATVAALGDNDGVVFLSEATAIDNATVYRTRIAYCLTKIAKQVVWHKEFSSAGVLPPPNAFLLGSFGPARDLADITALSHYGDDLLVCAGSREDIMLVDFNTGETKWKIPRIWEFRRGFIGPSVWQYFLSRYGLEEFDVEVAEMSLEQIRKKNKEDDGWFFDEQFYEETKKRVDGRKREIEKQPCWIAGGPVVVPDKSKGSPAHIFVATARGREGEWPGYLAKCVLYEIAGDGRVIGTAALPHFLRGHDHSILGSELLWLGRGGSLRAVPAREFGNPELIVDFDWRYARQHKPRDAWLRQGAVYPIAAFHRKYLITTREGAFISDSRDRKLQVPVIVVDLESNEEREIVIDIPFRGRVHPPSTNYSHTDGHWVIYQRFLMTLANIETTGSLALFTFEFGNYQRVLVFDLGKLFREQ